MGLACLEAPNAAKLAPPRQFPTGRPAAAQIFDKVERLPPLRPFVRTDPVGRKTFTGSGQRKQAFTVPDETNKTKGFA